ncbi:hypothetical protein [Lysobacter sp. FW306-1B-D06B]|uniref:hypothetical protein n=1 Tax=Lysobacter sp. FW306-1B-D06B TaxID=3140250 RepID=UPI0031406C17
MNKEVRLAALLCLMPWLAHAGETTLIEPSRYDAAEAQATGHPNELARWKGMRAYDEGKPAEAKVQFERAAWFGDTQSQYFLTLMHWQGDGVPRDPVMAYVWADLAAEGGEVEALVALRERIWSTLSPEQQRQAIETGRAFHPTFGKQATSRRLHSELRRFARQQTGSRLGQGVSKLEVGVGGTGAYGTRGRPSHESLQATGDTFYAAERTRYDDYRQAENARLSDLIRGAGQVKTGPVVPVRESTTD